MQSFRFISRYCKEYFFPSCSSTSGSRQPEFMQHPAIPLFFGFDCPGCSCLIENIPVSNLWLQAVGRQCSFCRQSHSDVLRFGDRCSKASPACLLAAWHVCGKPACLESAVARVSDMFAMACLWSASMFGARKCSFLRHVCDE